jgi:hypothetical protein
MGCSCEHINQTQLIIGGLFKCGFKKWACTTTKFEHIGPVQSDKIVVLLLKPIKDKQR